MQQLITKIANKVYYVVLITMLITFSILIYQTINIGNSNMNDYLNPIILIIGAIIYLCLIRKIKKILDKNIKNDNNKLAVIFCFVMFVVSFIFSIVIHSIPTIDLINIMAEAKNMVINNSMNNIYFYRWPNNLGALYIVKIIYQIANTFHIDYNILACAFSSLMMSITMYFSYLSIKKLTHKSNALTFLIILITNPLFYLYVSYYYSDVLCLPFMSIITYLMIINSKNQPNKKINNFLVLFFIGLLSFIGFKIRAVVILLLIAYIIKLIVTSKFKDLVIKLFIILCGIVVALGIDRFTSKTMNINMDSKYTFPSTHFIMMGLNKKANGKWNQEDFDTTYHEENQEKRKQKNIEVIKERLKNMTIHDMVDLQYEKMKTVWAYGDSSYSKYFELSNNYSNVYEYIAGNKTVLLSYILQINRIVLYLILLFSVYNEVLNKERKISFIGIAIFGAFVFYTLSEVYPRYSLSFIPLLTIFAAIHYAKLEKIKLSKVEMENEKKLINLNLQNIIKKSKYIIFAISIVLLITNYSYYTIEKKDYHIKAAYAYAENLGDKNAYIDDSTTLKQTFSTKIKFNSIILKISKKKDVDGNLTLELFDNNDKLLFGEKRSIKDLKGNSVEYTLPKSFNTSGKEYYIKISTDIKEKYAFGIVSGYEHYKENYDIFPGGTLILDNIDTKRDLIMNINEKVNKPILSKKCYILMSAVWILAEVYALDLIDKDKIKEMKLFNRRKD